MNFLISVLGALLGILLAIGIIIFVIYSKVRATVGAANMKVLTNAIKNAKDLEKSEYSREKNIRGMTNLLEEEIIRDFPDFNRNLIFSTCEANLTKIFNCIEKRDDQEIKNDTDFIYLKKYISELITDMKSNNITEKYDNIHFNKHAICAYSKKADKATIQVSTTLSYYYDTNRKDKKAFPDVKKQTRYTSEFVYVYDESKFDLNQIAFTVRCPNCGAPFNSLNGGYCKYCSSYVEKINSKIWKMSSFKEDYK